MLQRAAGNFEGNAGNVSELSYGEQNPSRFAAGDVLDGCAWCRRAPTVLKARHWYTTKSSPSPRAALEGGLDLSSNPTVPILSPNPVCPPRGPGVD